MIVRALDATGDWLFGKGLQDYKSNQLAVMQNISTRLKMFLGDCFFAASAGIDWFNLLGSKNQVTLNLAITAMITNTQFVTGVTQLSLNLDAARNLLITYNVSTSFGQSSGQTTISLG